VKGVKVHGSEVQWRSMEGESTCFRGTIERFEASGLEVSIEDFEKRVVS
jgi:hypothetical protein